MFNYHVYNSNRYILNLTVIIKIMTTLLTGGHDFIKLLL